MKNIFLIIFSATIFTGCSQTENVNYSGRTASDILQLNGNVRSVKEYVFTVSSDSNSLEYVLPVPIPREWIFHTNGTIAYQNSLTIKI